MGVIYVEGNYIRSSSKPTKIDAKQDDRIERLESILDGSDGSIENPEVLNQLIQKNSQQIASNSEDIKNIKTKIDSIETNVNKNTVTINGITVTISDVDDKLDRLNEKIDNLDVSSGVSWVEVQNN